MENIKVVYATDNNYAPLCIVSIYSLLENLYPHTKLSIYVFGYEIEEYYSAEIKLIAQKYDQEVILIDSKYILQRYIRIGVPKVNNSYSAYVRLSIPLELHSIMKYIYIDCDTLVMNDISELYSIDLQDYILGAVCDSMSAESNYAIGKQINDKYYNSGVMVVNADAWRKENITELLIKDLEKYNLNKTSTGSDQDMINYSMSANIKKIPLKYNLLTPNRIFRGENLLYMINKDAETYYSVDEIKKASEDPTIIHFAGNILIRPWFSNSNDPLVNIWDYYMEIWGVF